MPKRQKKSDAVEKAEKFVQGLKELTPVLVTSPDGSYTDENGLTRSSIDHRVIRNASEQNAAASSSQGPAAAAAAKPPEESPQSDDEDCPTIDEYEAAQKQLLAMRKKLVDAGKLEIKSRRRHDIDTKEFLPLGGSEDEESDEDLFSLSEADEEEINKILEEEKIDGSDDDVDERDDIEIEGMPEESDDGIDESSERSPEELQVLKDVKAARVVPMNVRKEMEEEVAKDLQGMIPGVKAGQGRLTNEWRAVAYILRKCHSYFQDYYKFTKGGKKIRPGPLPYGLIAALVYKSNGEHPTEGSVRSTILDMRAQVKVTRTFGRRTQGVGRPPLVSKDQVKLIADVLMKMKKEHDGYAFSFH